MFLVKNDVTVTELYVTKRETLCMVNMTFVIILSVFNFLLATKIALSSALFQRSLSYITAVSYHSSICGCNSVLTMVFARTGEFCFFI